MSDTVVPGAVVTWLERGALRFGVVAGEEKGRVRLVLKGGREERIKPNRIIVTVSAAGPAPGSSLEERRQVGERVAALEQRVKTEAAQIDLSLVWEIVSEDRDDDACGAVIDVMELATLALDSDFGDARAAVILALIDDGLRFKRSGDGWLPRSRNEITTLTVQRERAERRTVERDALFSMLRATVNGAEWQPAGTDAERRYLGALEQLAVHEDTATVADQILAREALKASGLSCDSPFEGAFKLLRALGQFDSDDQNLQVLRHRLRIDFSSSVLEYADRVAAAGFERSGRTDLTSLVTVSIDDHQTREIDDLLSLESPTPGRWRLGVHIADPAALVLPGDPLDDEAHQRSVTHYMPDMKLLMLPAAVSEVAASLQEGQLRPALSFLVDLDETGEITGYELVRSLVRSKARLTYDAVDSSLDTQDNQDAPFAALLAGLQAVAVARFEARTRSGAITLLTPETEVYLDAEGTPRLNALPANSNARRMVSEAMILTGEIAARFCIREQLPSLYRQQEIPQALPELPPGGVVDPVMINNVRRLMRRAETRLQPGPHRALGLPAYVQASSPLRRYQDLAVHRQIISSLCGESPCYDLEAMQRIAATTEQSELTARRAERAAREYWLLRYIELNRGEPLEGRVIRLEPRPVIQLTEILREQTMRSLDGVELGQLIRLRVEKVNPRAGLLVLNRID
jgi:exoribonuclease-2